MIKLPQSCVDVGAVRERFGKHERIFGRLGNAGADMRARTKGASRANATAANAWPDFQIVDRLQERLFAQADHLVELRPARALRPRASPHVSRQSRRRNGERVRCPGAVGQQAR